MNKKEKVLAVVSYLWILALIPILWKNKSKILLTHTSSGLVMLLLWSVILFIFQIPFIGVLLGLLLIIASLVFTIWGIVDAISGKAAEIPGVEKLAKYLR